MSVLYLEEEEGIPRCIWKAFSANSYLITSTPPPPLPISVNFMHKSSFMKNSFPDSLTVMLLPMLGHWGPWAVSDSLRVEIGCHLKPLKKVFEFSKWINYKLDFKRKRKWGHIGQQWLGFGHETCMRKRKWCLTMIKLIWKMHLPYFIHDSKCSIHVA